MKDRYIILYCTFLFSLMAGITIGSYLAAKDNQRQRMDAGRTVGEPAHGKHYTIIVKKIIA